MRLGQWQFVCLAIAVLLLGVLQLGLMRRVIAALERVSELGVNSGSPHGPGLGPGESVPVALAIAPDGHAVDVGELSRVGPITVLLASAECEPCHLVLAALADQGWEEAAALAVVCRGGLH